MSYHEWGDDWEYWDDLDAAVTFVHNYCKKWGRFSGQSKEKFGTLRFYCNFHHQLHDLIWPGHPWLRYEHDYWWPNKWMCKTFGKKLKWFDFNIYIKYFGWVIRSIRWWQTKVYTRAYKLAVKKWPHIKEEICCCADFDELLPFYEREDSEQIL